MKSCEHYDAIVCYPSGRCPMCEMELEIRELREKVDDLTKENDNLQTELENVK